MINVGLLTIFHAYNYGAVLQSYATFRVLENLGCNCELLNYDCTTMKNDRKMFTPIHSISSLLRNVGALVNYKQIRNRNDRFEEFIGRMKVSKRVWFNDYDFSDAPYDVLMTGSDQTFCLHLRNNPNEMKAFFLPICGRQMKVSYAPSLGEKIKEITADEEKWMRECFLQFESLSVRDQKSADYIERLIGIRPQVVLDPTLLLNSKQWDELIDDVEQVECDDYILFYTVLSEQWVVDYAMELSKHLGVKLIAVHKQNRFEVGKRITRILDCSPQQFLSLIKNAKYVITTSFHATVFSILYNKPLQSLVLGEGNRISSLLKQLDMKEALVFEDDNKVANKFYIDYTNANDKLQILRKESINYLTGIIERCDYR